MKQGRMSVVGALLYTTFVTTSLALTITQDLNRAVACGGVVFGLLQFAWALRHDR